MQWQILWCLSKFLQPRRGDLMCLFNQKSYYFFLFSFKIRKESKDRIRTKTAKSTLLFIVKPLDIYTHLNSLSAMTKYIIYTKQPYFYLIILQRTLFWALCLNWLIRLLQKKITKVHSSDLLHGYAFSFLCLFVHKYLSFQLHLTGLLLHNN